jgi:pimeloyl-ACP methyl ester carboxylesterase
MSPLQVMLLPGVVLPAAPAYGGLVTALGSRVEAVSKDLEVYRERVPPTGYSLDTEVTGVLAEADALGWDRFHLLGYSAGGAVALTTAARAPARLLSLGLLEPAWGGGWGWSAAHRRLWATYEQLGRLPPDQLMPAFMRLQVHADVALPPPPTPQPPWMAQRPAAIRAVMQAFTTAQLDRDVLAGFTPPVYFALGDRSNPDQFGDIADRLAQVFRDFTLETFPDRHHFDPPHRAEPQRLAASLMSLWLRAEGETHVR